MTFDRDHFVSDCVDATNGPTPEQAARELLAHAVGDADSVIANLGVPARGGVEALHVSGTLTILNVVWAPRMTLMPHNHNMWAVIGVYAGREDNIFWKRRKGDTTKIEAAGAQSLGAGNVAPLGANVIHSVTNPTSGFTGAIHVYGGDFFAKERSEWDPLSLIEQPYDVDKNIKLFEEANASLRDGETTGS